MINKKRALLVSCSLILLCMSVIVGMTYALFTDTVSVKNHLKAGSLDISLIRTDLEYSVLDDNGYLAVTKVEDDLNFTATTDENVFGIDATDIKIAPGSYFDADMALVNKGDVAFTYSVSIQLIGDANALAEQLQVTVTHPDGKTTTKMLNELSGGLSIATGEMSATDTLQTFSVRVEFMDVAANNEAQTQTAVFDLVVAAVQATA